MAIAKREIENGLCLRNGDIVDVSVPFCYTIGEVGPTTGNILRTLEDCENEVRAEIDQGVVNGASMCMTSEVSEI
jgi:hypothetical protein